MKHIPNFITCLNVISGTLAIFSVFNNQINYAVIFIILAMVFDFFDGFTARLLKAYSELGKELDSLADIVSFGVAPSFMAYHLILNTLPGAELTFWSSWNFGMKAMLFSPLLIPAFSALRLAKFNLDTRQTSSFIGMPTPALAIFWATLLIGREQGFYLYNLFFSNPYTLGFSVIILSLLLVSELGMFSLKVKNLSFRDNKILYLFFITLIILTLIVGKEIILFIIPIYILFSIIKTIIYIKKEH